MPTQTLGRANHCAVLPPMIKYLAASNDNERALCKISRCRHRPYRSATLTGIFHLLPFCSFSIPSRTRLLTFTVSHLFIPSAGDVSQPYTSFLLWKVRGGASIWARQRSREAEGSRISSRRHVGLISRSWPLLSCRHVIAGPRLC